MEVKIKKENGYVDADWTIENGVMVVSPKEVKFEPKDGDVVYSKGCKDFVFIYQDNLTTEVCYYAALSIKDNKIELPYEGYIGYVSQLRPAAEEEKKLLFDRLAEEGYSWDAERRELVKIKWKPKVDEPYFLPIFDVSGFNVRSFEWENVRVEGEYYKKGWIFKTKEECQEFCDRLNQAISQMKP